MLPAPTTDAQPSGKCNLHPPHARYLGLESVMHITVHIGYNKTGSTAIQRFMTAHRDWLAAQGLLYPQAGCVYDAHFGLSRLFCNLPAAEAVELQPDLLARIAAEAEQRGTRHVLLSSEYLTLADDDAVQRLHAELRAQFGDARLGVLVYLRRHDQWYESLFNEALKHTDQPPWKLDLQDYTLHAMSSAALASNYRGTLARWASVFGEGAVDLRLFHPERLHDSSLIRDFLSRLLPGVSPPEDAERFAANPSLPPTYAWLVGQLRRLPPNPQRNRAINDLIQAARVPAKVELAPADFGRFNTSQRSALYRLYEADYCELRARFRPELAGPLFPRPGAHDA